MNALVSERLREISINVNKPFIVYFVYDRPCRVVVACLFLCTLIFHTDVVAIFLFIR